MEKLFQTFKDTLIVHESYQGVVCGYCETHFILAVETTDTFKFFRALKADHFIEDEYKTLKYRYIFEDEKTIEKQMKWQDQRSNQLVLEKAS